MKNKHVFSFKNLEGVLYKVYYEKPKFWFYKKGKKRHYLNVLGTCDSPDLNKPKIIIDNKLSQKVELRVIIEEMIHSFYFEKLEKEVRPLAQTMANFLYKNGWRKQDQEK